MKTMSHAVAPEEIMALLDGELDAASASEVSAHVMGCEDCARLVEELKGTSAALREWGVPEASMRIPAVVMEAVERRSRKKPWMMWGFAGGGALAAVLLVAMFSFWNSHTRVQTLMVKKDEPVQEMSVENAPLQSLDGFSSAKPAPAVAGMGGGGGARAAKAKMAAPVMRGELPRFDTQAPLIARSASLIVQVKEITSARVVMENTLARYHGYVANLRLDAPDAKLRNLHADLKVPAGDLDRVLADLKTLGKVVLENQAGEDVTRQSVDLDARLKTARQTEERYRAILQQRTGSVSDVLEVEESIARVRTEIEEMETEQKGLAQRVQFASLGIDLTVPPDQPVDASIPGRLRDAVANGWKNFVEAVVGIAVFFAENTLTLLVWVVVLGVPSLLIWRRWRRLVGRV